MDLRSEQRDAITARAHRTQEVQTVILFGSRASGTSCPLCDVDIALELNVPNPMGHLVCERSEWERELMSATSLLVRINSINEPVIADALAEHGVIIFSRLPAL